MKPKPLNINISEFKNKLIQEIKIEDPTKVFFVTDKGKELLKTYSNFSKALNLLSKNNLISDKTQDIITDEIHNDDDFIEFLTFSIHVDKVIINPNTINRLPIVMDGFINKIGVFDTEEEVKKVLQSWMDEGWITRFNLD